MNKIMQKMKNNPFFSGLRTVTDWLKKYGKGGGVGQTLAALGLIFVFQCIVLGINAGSFGAFLPKLGMTWLNILRNNSYVGLIALGSCFVIISGGIDLSVGSILCAVGAFTMYLLDGSSGLLAAIRITGAPAYLIAILAALLLGLVLGEINGCLIAYGKIPPFIVTLGTMLIYRSATQQLTKTFSPVVPAGFKQLASFKIGGQIILPILYWALVAAILIVVFRKTAFGKHTVAVGSNEKAALYAGIPVKRVKRRIYALCGVCCSVAALIYVARIGSMDFANAGSGYEMDAIAGVVVGGTAMSGGKGSVLGCVIGVLIMSVMNNILNSIGIPTFLCNAVKGLIIILTVLLQNRKND